MTSNFERMVAQGIGWVMKRISDIGYSDAHELSLDIYLPDHLRAKACVLYAHGAADDAQGHKRPEVAYLANLITQANMAFVAVQYRLGVTLETFSSIDMQYIESFVSRGHRIGLTLTPDLMGPQFISTAQDLSDVVQFLRNQGKTLRVPCETFGVLGASAGGVAALGMAYPPQQWEARFARPRAVATIASAMAQPWRLSMEGPSCLMFGSSCDVETNFLDLKMAAFRGRQVGADIAVVDTRRPGHLRQIDVVLDQVGDDGRPYRDQLRDHFTDWLIPQSRDTLYVAFDRDLSVRYPRPFSVAGR